MVYIHLYNLAGHKPNNLKIGVLSMQNQTTTLTRRAGEIIRVITHGEVIETIKAHTVRKVLKRKVTVDDRANISHPDRRDLTKAQFQEWSMALRNLRQNDYVNAHIMSLNDMRDAIRSFTICQARCLAYDTGLI